MFLISKGSCWLVKPPNHIPVQVPVPLLAELEAVHAAARSVGPAPAARQSHPQLFGRRGKVTSEFHKQSLRVKNVEFTQPRAIYLPSLYLTFWTAGQHQRRRTLRLQGLCGRPRAGGDGQEVQEGDQVGQVQCSPDNVTPCVKLLTDNLTKKICNYSI